MESHSRYEGEVFRRVTFSAETLEQTSFDGCSFTDCHFSETTFSSCRFNDCAFKECDLTMATFAYCDMALVSWQDCKLVGINWTQIEPLGLTIGAPFSFERCVLNHGTFFGMNLPQLVMLSCSAEGVDFRDCNLTSAEFSATDFNQALFHNSNLSQADLSKATNYAISAETNTLSNAKFALPEAISLLYALDITLIE